MERTKSLGKGKSCMKLTAFIVAVFILVGCSPQKKAEEETINKDLDIYNNDYIFTNEQTDYFTEGGRLYFENRLDEAEKYLKKAIDNDPLFAGAMDLLGMVYEKQNRLPEAEEIYLRSIEIKNTKKLPYKKLANLYVLQGRLDDAFELYVKIIQLDKNDPEGYCGIAGIFRTDGNYQGASIFYDKAIELYEDKNVPPPYAVIEWLYNRDYRYLLQ